MTLELRYLKKVNIGLMRKELYLGFGFILQVILFCEL